MKSLRHCQNEIFMYDRSILEMLGRTIDADGLVTRGGFAGVWAAIRTRDFSQKLCW